MPPYTAFCGPKRFAEGALAIIAVAAAEVSHAGLPEPVLVFDDQTGRVVDLDLRGTAEEVASRYAPVVEAPARGRPKLGVTAREVTLLPSQWDWLSRQPGGASATLRRLIDEARRDPNSKAAHRAAQEAAYRFLSAMAGDLPGFEEASRALFAGDRAGFEREGAGWPDDVRAYGVGLAFG